MLTLAFHRIVAGQNYATLTPTFDPVEARTKSKVAPACNVVYIVTMENTREDVPFGPILLDEDDVVQVVLLKPTFDWVQDEIRARGLYLFPIPVGGEDLPTYGVGVGRRLWGIASRPVECDGCLCPLEHDGDYGSSGHAGPCPPHTCGIS